MSFKHIVKLVSNNNYIVNTFLLPNTITGSSSIINTQIGELSIFHENKIATITSHEILPKYRNQGVGTDLLKESEMFMFNNLKIDKINLNLWPLDSCYFNYNNFYLNRGYINSLPLNNILHLDDGNNIQYFISMEKKKM